MSLLKTIKNPPSPQSKPVLRKPHKFQKRAVEWLVKRGGAGLFIDPGGGKTSIVLRALLALKDAGVLRRALIVAPLRVATTVWPAEAAEWEGTEWDRLRTLKVRVLHGKRKDWEAEQDADVYVINFDGLKWLFESGTYRRFQRMKIDTLVVDESTRLKHTQTKRFKMLRPALPTFARRWVLTGSPTPNGLMDIFGQIFCIDLGKALGKFITHFRFQYFTQLGMWNWMLKPGAEEQIQRAIAPYIFRLDVSDYLQMPELVENVVRVDLPKDVRKIYDELEEELIAQLEDDTVVTALSSGVAAMKCAQICNGGIYLEAEPGNRERTWTDLHTAKLEAVQEIADELHGPVMIVYDFKHDLARLQKLYPNAPHIGGDTSAKESAQIIADWNADKINELLVQALSVSHGLNLQRGAAQHVIWHSLTYDREVYDQLIRRLRRQGSRHATIFSHLIVVRDSTDEARLRALKRKGKAMDNFLMAMKEYAKERAR